MKIIPRDYQEEAINIGLDFFNTVRKLPPSLIIGATGSGKSVIIGHIAAQLDHPVLVLQPSVELLVQNHDKLLNYGGSATIYCSSLKQKELSNTVFGTLESLRKKGKELREFGIKYVIIDEAHKYSPKTGSSFRKFIKDLKPNKVLGLTATPFRLRSYGNRFSGYSQLNMLMKGVKGEPAFFKKILYNISIEKMVSDKYWANIDYECYDFDEGLLKFDNSNSDFTKESVSIAIKNQNINNNIYLRLRDLVSKGKRCLVFVDSVENSEKMGSLFGNLSASVSYMTSPEDRERIIRDFKSGKILVVCNYDTLGVGFDYPELDTVILGRPTNSLAKYYQWCGRVCRNPIFPDQKQALLIDFCNNNKRFGNIQDLRLENVEKYGWGFFTSDNRLLTNTPMNVEVNKKDLYRNISKYKSLKPKDMVLNFGKHKGKKLSEIPKGYLLFMKGNFDFNKNIEYKQLEISIDEILK